jgi:DNA-binding MarR family transcriptional regulator
MNSSSYRKFLKLIESVNAKHGLDSHERQLMDFVGLAALKGGGNLVVGDLISLKEIASQATLHGAVSRLAKNGYLKLETSKTDGRIKNVVLGKKGIARQAELSKALEAATK